MAGFLVEKLERVQNGFQGGSESRKGVIRKLFIVFFTIGYAAKYYAPVFCIIRIQEPTLDKAG